LLTAVLEHLRAQPQEGMWAAVTYFSLWAVRLSGFLENQRVTPESRSIAEEMLRTPIGRLSGRLWTRETAQDLRRSLIRSMEDHMERRLYTANVLETL
jgi:DNA repair protein RecO (recombination protein O)